MRDADKEGKPMTSNNIQKRLRLLSTNKDEGERRHPRGNRSSALGSFLDRDRLFFAHRTNDGDEEILASVKVGANLLPDVAVGGLDIILRFTLIVHEIKVAIVDVDKLVFVTPDMRDIHIVSGGTDIFQLLVGEDVDGNEMDLCVTVLSGLGGGHVDDFAGTAFDNDVTAFTKS